MQEWMDATFWAFVALVLFFILMAYFGVHKVIVKMLDARIAQIGNELAEAKRLREEAAALLIEYQQKRVAAESEAEDIIAAAKDEANRMTADAQTALAELLVRRTKNVEDKIAQAEAQAVAEVRARSADVAVEAARLLLVEQMSTKGDSLVERAIADVGSRLN